MTEDALTTLKYVDDLTLIETRSRDKSPVMQDHLDKFSDWAKHNNMKLNRSKCAHMRVSFLKNQDEDHVLTIDQVPLQEISTTKILSVHVSSDLKWSNHICEVLKKANSRLYLLKLLKHFNLPTDDLVTIYSGFVRPTVEYAAPQTNLPCRNSELFVTNSVRCCTWLNCRPIMITALKVISVWFWFCIILWLDWFYVHLCYGWLFCWSVTGVYWLVCGGMWVWCVECVWRWGVWGVCDGCLCGCVCRGRCEVWGVCVCVCKKSFYWMLLNGFLSFVDMVWVKLIVSFAIFVSYIICFAILFVLLVSLIVKLL